MSGFSIHRHLFDFMHMLYSKGVANDFTCAMIACLCNSGTFLGADLEEQLAHAFLDNRKWAAMQSIGRDQHRCKPFSLGPTWA